MQEKNTHNVNFILTRLKSALSFKTNKQLAAFLGVSEQGISSWKIRNTIDYELIFAKCVNIDLNWLIKGSSDDNNSNKNGRPLIKNMGIQLGAHSKNIVSTLGVSESSTWYAPKVITVVPEGGEAAVMIDIKAAAGFPFNIDNPEYYSALPTIQLPRRQFNGGTFICIQAKGDSMHPTIFHQDWVICRFEDDPLHNIKDGYVYVVVTKDGVLVKRCLNRLEKRGKLVIQSDNSIGYPIDEIDASDILQIYKAEAKLSFNLGNLNATVHQRLNNIEIELLEIRKEFEKEGSMQKTSRKKS